MTNNRTFTELLAVGNFMKDFPGQWWVGGGWAIDLWMGQVSREHEDIEICVLRHDQEFIYPICGDWAFFTPINNQWSQMERGEQLNASNSMLQLRRQASTQGLTPEMPPEFEFILNDIENEEWIFRFDPNIRLPLAKVYYRSSVGLPAAYPEVILLHKAWYPARPKDEHDFMMVRNHLDATRRTWLVQQLQSIRPDHAWLRQLV